MGQNAPHTPGLTPDGEFAVVPISTENQLNAYNTNSYEHVPTVSVGDGPWDMMVSSDGKYCCGPDVNSDWLTIVDPKTWKVIGRFRPARGAGFLA